MAADFKFENSPEIQYLIPEDGICRDVETGAVQGNSGYFPVLT